MLEVTIMNTAAYVQHARFRRETAAIGVDFWSESNDDTVLRLFQQEWARPPLMVTLGELRAWLMSRASAQEPALKPESTGEPEPAAAPDTALRISAPLPDPDIQF